MQEETTFKRLNMSEVPPDLRELMEDSNDGLVFETKEDKTIIKAGKLVRLVERLADNKLTGLFNILDCVLNLYIRLRIP